MIACQNGNVNGHYDGSCERTDCIDGVLACDCGERPAVSRLPDGMPICQVCLDADAARGAA